MESYSAPQLRDGRGVHITGRNFMGKGWRTMTDRHGKGYFPNINEIKSGVQKENSYFGK